MAQRKGVGGGKSREVTKAKGIVFARGGGAGGGINWRDVRGEERGVYLTFLDIFFPIPFPSWRLPA